MRDIFSISSKKRVDLGGSIVAFASDAKASSKIDDAFGIFEPIKMIGISTPSRKGTLVCAIQVGKFDFTSITAPTAPIEDDRTF